MVLWAEKKTGNLGWVGSHWRSAGTGPLVPLVEEKTRNLGCVAPPGRGGSVAVPRYCKAGLDTRPSLSGPLVLLEEEKTRNLGCMASVERRGSVAVPRHSNYTF